jgi:hypothetical protein
MLCTVRDLPGAEKAVVSYADKAPKTPQPTTFWEVLRKWQREWIWENLQWIGDNWCITCAIEEGTCMAVTDGLYMRDLYPQIHLSALVFECKKGRGWLWCSFTETSEVACSYRGELMGLMAIHLILLAVNEIAPGLKGGVHIFLDCLGALEKVKNLPPSRIPSYLAHLGILKNILVNCSGLSFDRFYSHVRAHQDNREDYQGLSRQSQLNKIMDYNAKRALLDLPSSDPPCQQAFPLEPVCVYAGGWKITADMAPQVRYLAHLHLAQEKFCQMKILDGQVFDLVDWEMIHKTLHKVPRLFQQWACKQVMGIAGTMEWDKNQCIRCPSCMQEWDTCVHVLFCNHAGQVKTLMHTIDLMEQWLTDGETDPELLNFIAEYAHGRGGHTMAEICYGLGETYQKMAREQDAIG